MFLGLMILSLIIKKFFDVEINKNSLSGNLSPYLKQHKDNPVNWQTWSRETLNYAKINKKPILLSVEASCHWCHVMAHESFDDIETAEIMNQHFLNIKVDREERPDLDFIFQSSFQLFNQTGGGWPLTMFLDNAVYHLWEVHISKMQNMDFLALKKYLRKFQRLIKIKEKI